MVFWSSGFWIPGTTPAKPEAALTYQNLLFCRVPTISILGCIIRTYKKVEFGRLRCAPHFSTVFVLVIGLSAEDTRGSHRLRHLDTPNEGLGVWDLPQVSKVSNNQTPNQGLGFRVLGFGFRVQGLGRTYVISVSTQLSGTCYLGYLEAPYIIPLWNQVPKTLIRMVFWGLIP